MQLDLQVEGFLSRASRGAFVSGDRFKAFIHGLGYSSSPQVPTDPPGCRVGVRTWKCYHEKYEEIEIQWDFKGKTCGDLMSFSIVVVMLMGRNGSKKW